MHSIRFSILQGGLALLVVTHQPVHRNAMGGSDARAPGRPRRPMGRSPGAQGLRPVEAVRLVAGVRCSGARRFSHAPVPWPLLGDWPGGAVAIGGAAWRASLNNKQATTYGSARWAASGAMCATPDLFAREGHRAGPLGQAGICGMTAPSTCWPSPRRGRARAPAWSSPPCWHSRAPRWSRYQGGELAAHCRLAGQVLALPLFDPTAAAPVRFNPLLEMRKGREGSPGYPEHRGYPGRSRGHPRTPGSLGTDRACPAGRRDSTRALRRRGQDARRRRRFPPNPRARSGAVVEMMATTHLGPTRRAQVPAVVASAAREMLNKSPNERSGVLSTAMSFLRLYRDPMVAATTARADLRLADLMGAERPGLALSGRAAFRYRAHAASGTV